MDLKKEIKLSDLFRRNGKDTAEEADEGAPEEPKAKRRLFSRVPRDSNGAGEPTGDNGHLGAAAKTAPPVPQIPLMRAFDLLPKDQRREDSERRPGLIQIGVALFAVVILAALGALFLMTSSSLNDKRRERDALQSQLAALQVQAEKPSSNAGPELEGERAARTNALATALSGRVAWDRLLRDISLVLPADVYLTALTAQSPTPASAPTPAATSTTATQFAITGTTGNQEDVALLLSRLSILPELSGVQLVSSLRGDEGDIVFSISAAVRHEAATP
jgi:Tfp pilus assembly protein PilN